MICTGGSGLLGRELRKLLPQASFPESNQFDVTDYRQMERYVKNRSYEQIIHGAAFTSPPACDADPLKALETNIAGTCNVVKLCMTYDLNLTYISTDYVFRGDKGNYREEDPVHPVNKYSWSKLGGECAVRMYDKSLIIRTSFGPDVFPFPGAFVDQWTSREAVTVIAGKIVDLVGRNLTGVIHIGAKRRSVYDYAKSLDPDREIGEISIDDVSFTVPVDVSLNTDRYEAEMNKKK